MKAFKPLPSNHQWIKKTFYHYLNCVNAMLAKYITQKYMA